MIISKVKSWYVPDAIYDINQIEALPPTLELIKKSILKSGYRAFCLNDRPEIENSSWYSSYLLNDKVFFYIEGSGIYKLANLDLVENEFYFEKSNLPAGYRPWIFYSWQRGVRLILRSKLGKMTVDEKRPELLPAIA